MAAAGGLGKNNKSPPPHSGSRLKKDALLNYANTPLYLEHFFTYVFQLDVGNGK